MPAAYYDRDADVAWIPTGESDDVVSERVPDGVHDYDRVTRRLVAIEIWGASTRLPRTLLEALPAPEQRGDVPARAPDRSLPEPLHLAGDPRALSRALEEVRGSPNAYERFLAEQRADPEFRTEFERERQEIETIDAIIDALDADISRSRRAPEPAYHPAPPHP